MKKLKLSGKEADKEAGKVTSTLPAHALIAAVPPGPLVDSILALCDTETSLPPLRSDDKQDITSLPPLEMEEEQTEATLPPPEGGTGVGGREPQCPISYHGSTQYADEDKIQYLPKLILSFSQKLSQAQERNQEHMHHSLPSDGDGRPPVSVTPEVCSDHENNTQQHEDDETPNEVEEAHLSESHGQALQTPQKDEKGENPHKNYEIEEILENPPSPENNHFPDTFHDTSGLPKRSSMPGLYVRQDFEKEGDFLHTSENTCSDLPNNQKLSSSQESGPFLDPLPNA
ncbi:hypothetical protein JTB14_022946 [Gonioctena quinquepunctata]|nr:hypothetical protein JTB14_022946 [Gonioctena quinquepunctata]